MKRPALIPADVWENLTIADAARAGLLGAFPDELLRNKTDLLRDCGDWTMVARLLSENIDDESVRNACRIVRTRDKPNRPRRLEPSRLSYRDGLQQPIRCASPGPPLSAQGGT
jgi:hypothetical protein